MERTQPPPRPHGRAMERRTYRESIISRKEPEEEPEKIVGLPRWKKEARSFLFDILAAFIVLFLLVGGLYTYTDNWPPLVVVQSGSMQHSNDMSYVGVIDTGDLVFVKKTEGESDIIPYFEGIDKDYRTYDSFGDVIIFRPNGDADRTAIIHRAVMYLEFNDTDLDWDNNLYGGFDIPLTGQMNFKGILTIEGYEWPEGTKDMGLLIDLGDILYSFYEFKIKPHGGFITKGDDNAGVDQTSGFTDPKWIEPVEEDWVIGRSVGELPWFGIIKLKIEGNDNWNDNSMKNLIIALIVLVSFPFILDLGIHSIGKVFGKEREEPEPDLPRTVSRQRPMRASAEMERHYRSRRPPPGREK